MMITYRQGSNKGGNSHGEEAKSKRDGHIFRNHLTHENRYDFEHQTRPDCIGCTNLDKRNSAAPEGTVCETKDCRVNAVTGHAENKFNHH